jgi:phosphoesterase RecJ-like protein
MRSNSDLKEIKELLLSCRDRVYIFSHPYPDGDSIGSTMGLYHLLRSAGVQAVPVLPPPLPRSYEFLLSGAEVLSPPVDIAGGTAVVLDCGDLRRLRETGQSLEGAARIINIDHHLNNDMFGDYNYVDCQAAAVGQILLAMFAGSPCPPPAAEALYTAMYTDTGRFSYSNTSADALAAAAELVKSGARPQRVFNEIYQNRSREYYSLLAEVLAGMEITHNGLVASISLDRELMGKHRVCEWELDELSDYPRSLRGVLVSVIFKEVGENTVKVSLRSKEHVNVAAVARELGGGGHHNAAGVTLNMSLAQARQQVLARLEAGLSP